METVWILKLTGASERVMAHRQGRGGGESGPSLERGDGCSLALEKTDRTLEVNNQIGK